ncbi:hypothetical protein GLOIN_2v1786555 [Rhizophagus irregularis DAOM 181602=DAOM 197198]|nr:hypothetical protein GLOIN_2v1786555 [Rhizophagus irregularis DAOM 181602=DAOM 197198]
MGNLHFLNFGQWCPFDLCHVQFYQSHSSRILSVDLFFKGNVKLRIFVVYIPPTNDLVLQYEVIDQLISLISQTSSQNFHHAICVL